MNAAERQRLFHQRDIALLNCANAIEFVLAMFEAQDFEESRKFLADALDQYKQAEAALQFRKGEQDHGNRAA